MFKNNAFKASVDTKKWWKAAGIRAVKTMAQVAGAMLVTGQTASEVDWLNIASVAFVAGVISICTSIAGVPEVKESEEK